VWRNCFDRPAAASGRVLSALLVIWAGCGGSHPSGAVAPLSLTGLGVLDRARFIWVSAQCVDGVLDLASSGFERNLITEVRGPALRFTYDTKLARPDCVSTEIWSLTPASAGQWTFQPEAQVSLPADVTCGANADASGLGVLGLNGDILEELRFSSPWCRGYDVRFVYRRVPDAVLSRDQIIRRYAAHWNRRDPAAIAGLFAEHGLLIEPFSWSADGTPVRHEGRNDIERWLTKAFATTPWSAMQLAGVETLDEAGQALAVWSYFDARLAEPLAGRNLFLLAGGEIFATELQLLAEPVAKAPTSPTTP
jgi:hypothetical protein